MLSWTEISIRLILAAIFGAIIGLERERKNWTAGLRTHMMVCVGSSLIMMVSSFGFEDILGSANVNLDPSRIAAQVVSGIGFIGAGTILFQKQGTIRGLTTASGLWTVAAIGLATGGGMYFAASATTLLAIIILWMLQPLEKKFSERFVSKNLRIVTQNKVKSIEIVNQLFTNNEFEISHYAINKADDDYIVIIRFKILNKEILNSIIHDLNTDETIKEVSWNS